MKRYINNKLHNNSMGKSILILMILFIFTPSIFATNTTNTTDNSIESKLTDGQTLYLNLNNDTNKLFVILFIVMGIFLLFTSYNLFGSIILILTGFILLLNGFNILLSFVLVSVAVYSVFKEK